MTHIDQTVEAILAGTAKHAMRAELEQYRDMPAHEARAYADEYAKTLNVWEEPGWIVARCREQFFTDAQIRLVLATLRYRIAAFYEQVDRTAAELNSGVERT